MREKSKTERKIEKHVYKCIAPALSYLLHQHHDNPGRYSLYILLCINKFLLSVRQPVWLFSKCEPWVIDDIMIKTQKFLYQYVMNP